MIPDRQPPVVREAAAGRAASSGRRWSRGRSTRRSRCSRRPRPARASTGVPRGHQAGRGAVAHALARRRRRPAADACTDRAERRPGRRARWPAAGSAPVARHAARTASSRPSSRPPAAAPRRSSTRSPMATTRPRASRALPGDSTPNGRFWTVKSVARHRWPTCTQLAAAGSCVRFSDAASPSDTAQAQPERLQFGDGLFERARPESEVKNSPRATRDILAAETAVPPGRPARRRR